MADAAAWFRLKTRGKAGQMNTYDRVYELLLEKRLKKALTKFGGEWMSPEEKEDWLRQRKAAGVEGWRGPYPHQSRRSRVRTTRHYREKVMAEIPKTPRWDEG